MGEGFRTNPIGSAAMPPYTNGPYKFSEDITFNGDLRKSPGRVYFEEFFKRLPVLNANIAIATNLDFEVLGTHATAAQVTNSATMAGIVLTSAGADNDQVFVLPQLNAGQSGWSTKKWGTENQVIWETALTTGDDIATGVLLFAGLKLTNNPVIATDANQAFFRFSTDDSDENWMIESSIANDNIATDSGVAVVKNTTYKFRIKIDSSRKAHFYINEKEIYVSAALTDDIDLIPYVGIQALSATAEFVTLHYEKISRILFE